MGIENMNIFAKVKLYASKWKQTGRRPFSPDEIAAVERTEVVASQYGNSVCFFMKQGGMAYIPLSKESTLGIGESIDMNNAKLLTLSKQGEDDILRVEA